MGRIRSLLSRLTGSILAATLVVLLCVIRLVDPSPVEVLRLKSFDFLIRSLPHKTSEEIVIVDFGEKSADKFGQWPFDRRDIAHVIHALVEAAGELRRDGLDRDFLVSDGCEDDEQLGRRLRRIGFVHRDHF